MASGSIVGEGGNEVPREKQRFLESKVYTRKSFRGQKKNVEGVTASVTPSPTATASPAVPVAEKSTVPASAENNTVRRQSGDADESASGIVRETDAGAVSTDEPRIATTPSSDAEKGIEKHNGNVVVVEPHVLAPKAAESEARPMEGVVVESKGCALIEDAAAEPQACTSVKVTAAEPEARASEEAANEDHPLQEDRAAEPIPRPSGEGMVAEPPARPVEGKVAEPPACPSEDKVAEPPAGPSEDKVAEPPARPSEDKVAEAPDGPSEGMVAEAPDGPSDDMVAQPTVHPSEDMVTEPAAHPPEDMVTEPAAHPPEDMVTEPAAHPSEDMVTEPPPCSLEDMVTEPPAQPSEETAAGPEVGLSEDMIVEPVAPPSEDSARKRQEGSVEDVAVGQQQSASLPDAPSDDSMSHNRQVEMPSVAGNDEQNGGLESRVKVNLSSRSKQERIELRRKLESELVIVRGLVKRIEAKQGQLGFGGISGLRVSVNDGMDAGLRRVSSDVGSIGVPRESTAPLRTPTPRQSRPLSQLSISVMENGQGVGESFEKEKRTPKANQFYRNSEFLLAKDKFPPAESNKKSKLNGKKHGGELGLGFGPNTKVFKSCSALLERLMKHKHGWVFNSPVDVEGLRLHDYFTIIKHPMDLGTVKSRLGKNWYKAPEEFAEDVRLTFHNALTYNPKGQDVHFMAEQLLKIFEDKWATIKSDYDREMRFTTTYHMAVRTPPPRKAPLLPVAPLDMSRILERSESMTYSSFETRPKSMSNTPSGRTPAPKKPKAKDPNKRDMTYEEKQKLSTNLQSLPSEKLDNIVQIIKKRNSTLSQHDDEIEVDIDSVDAETLWELDRFVTNYKKSLSKNKRKAELAMQARVAEQKTQEKTPATIVVEAPKETNSNRDERNVTTSSPAQVEKQGDNGSRSSSSSSSSSDSGSSSSDSDSDSSSASGSV